MIEDAEIEKHIKAWLEGGHPPLHQSTVAMAIAYRQMKATEALLEYHSRSNPLPLNGNRQSNTANQYQEAQASSALDAQYKQEP